MKDKFNERKIKMQMKTELIIGQKGDISIFFFMWKRGISLNGTKCPLGIVMLVSSHLF